jgi:hypothetical protein
MQICLDNYRFCWRASVHTVVDLDVMYHRIECVGIVLN